MLILATTISFLVCYNKNIMQSIKQAVILAGGLGIRLRPLTFTTPKPMILIHTKPLLAYIIELLRKNGITHILLLVGYLHEQIEEYFKDGKEFGISIGYSYSPIEADTGTRIKNAIPLLDQNFLLLYGDNYWPLNLANLVEFYKRMKTKASVVAYHNSDDATKHNMFIDEKGFVQVYDKTRASKNLNGLDIGFFLLDKTILNNLPEDNFSFEEIMIPRLAQNQELAGFMTHDKYYSLSNPSRIPLIEEYFKREKLI